mgnify:CR=1 FL=1
MNQLKELANQTVVYGLSSIIGRLLNYLLVPLYTRYFIPSEYGVVTEIYAYVAFLVVFLTYGMETAFFHFSNKEEKPKTVYSTTLTSIIISSLLFIICVFLNIASISEFMGYEQNQEYIQWFAIIIFLDAISSIPFARLRYKNQAIKFSTIKLLSIFTNITLNLYFIIYKEYGIEYIFISNLISSVLTFLLLISELPLLNWRFDKIIWRKMINYSLPLLFVGLAGVINEAIDRVLLKHFLLDSKKAMSELGLYGAFYKLSVIMILFIQAFRFAAEPFFFSKQKQDNNRHIYADVMKYFIIVGSTIFLIVTIFYDFFKQFLGQEFHDERGFLVVSILLFANLLLGVYYNLSIWYKLTEKTIFGAIISVTGAIITLILNVILIPKIGFIGCAWATLACYSLMVIASYILGRKHFAIPYNIKRIIIYVSSMLAIYLIMLCTPYGITINSLGLVAFITLVFFLEKRKKSIKFIN